MGDAVSGFIDSRNLKESPTRCICGESRANPDISPKSVAPVSPKPQATAEEVRVGVNVSEKNLISPQEYLGIARNVLSTELCEVISARNIDSPSWRRTILLLQLNFFR
jgi:hypothetical protein